MDVWTPGPISIHAPREGCDLCLCRRLTSTITISIHAPREGCDVITKFRRSLERDFNPRTPRGVRREVLDNGVVVHGNSNPRTPRGVRPRRKGLHWITDRFQSTHPARGATVGGQIDVHLLLISIHAPREGCDWVKARRAAYFTEFQSTHPARGATSWAELDAEAQEFQSTHPARGATLHRRYPRHVKEISIHAPREGCDISRRSVADDKQNFNPRTPRGVRQLLSCLQNSLPRRFQSTHPARGATLGEQQGCPSMRFQSTHPARGATSKVDLVFQQAKISIHAPREGCDLG